MASWLEGSSKLASSSRMVDSDTPEPRICRPGARRWELYPLRWHCVDFMTGVLQIRTSVAQQGATTWRTPRLISRGGSLSTRRRWRC